MRMRAMSGAMLVVSGLWAAQASAHCQVPCGIYDDPARVAQLREDVKTIEKAVQLIGQLAAKRDAESANQLVRWIDTKETHAERIVRTISDYFLLQRIKPADKGKERAAYMDKLARHHAVMLAAMVCKQTVSAANVKTLAKAVDGIAGYWR